MSGADVSVIFQLLGHENYSLRGRDEREHSFPIIELFSFGIRFEGFSA